MAKKNVTPDPALFATEATEEHHEALDLPSEEDELTPAEEKLVGALAETLASPEVEEIARRFEDETAEDTGTGSEFFVYEAHQIVELRSMARNSGKPLLSRDDYIAFLQAATPGRYVVLEVVAEPEAVAPKGLNTVRANPRRKRSRTGGTE